MVTGNNLALCYRDFRIMHYVLVLVQWFSFLSIHEEIAYIYVYKLDLLYKRPASRAGLGLEVMVVMVNLLGVTLAGSEKEFVVG